jgi:hypothetical protein
MKRARKRSRQPTDAVLEALRHELRALLSQPVLDAAVLHKIGKVAAAGGQLLMARDPRQKIHLPRENGVAPIYTGGDDQDDSAGEMIANPNVTGQSAGPETYGAKLLREIMANIGPLTAAMRDTPGALVMALADARRNGLDDVAAILEKRLGVEPPKNGKKPKRPVGPVPVLGDFPLLRATPPTVIGALSGAAATV